jgi:hypothetical protein
MARTTMSRSVMSPTSRPLAAVRAGTRWTSVTESEGVSPCSTTGMTPVSSSRIMRATSSSVVSRAATVTSRVMMSRQRRCERVAPPRRPRPYSSRGGGVGLRPYSRSSGARP